MRHILIIFSIFLFSLSIISCSSDDGSKSAVAESRAIQTILADDSWQSKAWFLERRFPERWRRKDRLDAHHTREPKVVFHTIKQMSEQEWNEVHGTETKELNSVKALN